MPTPPDVSALEVRGLVKRFGKKVAVEGLDITLPRGSVLGLLGPNGAGKTTTVEMCEGFMRPDAGTIRVLGLDPVADRQRVRNRIGSMIQDGGAYPSARIGEMIRLVASYYADPLDPDWLIECLGLRDHQSTPFRRLSGGQRQRLSLACALVGRPELIFLDEPTAGLDAQSRLLVWDLVRALRRDGTAVVLTTHLMDEAAELSDEIMIVDRGACIARGTPSEIERIGTDAGVTLTVEPDVDVDALSATLARSLDLEATCAGQGRGRIRVRGEVSPSLLTRLCTVCEKAGVQITALDTSGRSLEDVFLDLTGRELR